MVIDDLDAVKDLRWLNQQNAGKNFNQLCHSEKTKKKISESKKGIRASDEAKNKMRSSHIGLKQSAITIAKRISKNTGKKRTSDQISRLRKGHRNRSHVCCLFCRLETAINRYQWHYDHCKKKDR